MSESAPKPDAPDVVIQPPVALILGLMAAFAMNWLIPLPFMAAGAPRVEIGLILLLVALLLIRWSITTLRNAKTGILTHKPSSAIVTSGPYRYGRNPIYLAALLGLAAFAIGFDSLWFFVMLVAIYFVFRYGVIGREETYLERKFDGEYLDYKAKVRRWF
jgi:protein-S-isoprenylcysteine O-methyltransferase Ste14